MDCKLVCFKLTMTNSFYWLLKLKKILDIGCRISYEKRIFLFK